MSLKFDFIIVGGGVTGLSTALHLASHGAGRIAILERHHVGAGQSGRAAGILRSTVRNAGLAAWQAESARFLIELPDRFGETVPIHHAGYLLLADREQADSIDETIRVANTAGCQVSRIDAHQALDLQPGIRVDEQTIFAFEPGAIHLDPMIATQALARIARRLGVSIFEGHSVQTLTVDGMNAILGTETETFESPSVLFGTSCWMPLQIERFGWGVPIQPHRAEMGFFHVPVHQKQRLERILSDATSGIYLRAEGRDQMFVGWREGDWVKSLEDCDVQDPDLARQTAGYEAVTDLHAALSSTLPWMSEGFVHRTFACTYDYSPDGMPILEKLESSAGLYLAGGFSGGGFSLSPFIGRMMAEYLRTGQRPPEICELSSARFQNGRGLQWSNQ